MAAVLGPEAQPNRYYHFKFSRMESALVVISKPLRQYSIKPVRISIELTNSGLSDLGTLGGKKMSNFAHEV